MRTPALSLLLASSFGLAACAADSTPTALGGRLSIDSPSNGAVINVPLSQQIAVEFSTNYTLKEPGHCGSQDGCGSVYLLVDGTACNQAGRPYNMLTTSSPAEFDLSHCSMTIGQHTLSAELHHDDGRFVEDSVTHDPVISSVTVTVQP